MQRAVVFLFVIFGWLIARLALLFPAVRRKPSLVWLAGLCATAGVLVALAPDRRQGGYNPILFALFPVTGMMTGVALAARRTAPGTLPPGR